MSEKQTILIVDDHSLFRTGLSLILTQSNTDYSTVEANSVMDAMKFVNKTIDAVFLDIQMPGINGLDGIKVISERFPDVPVVIISASDSVEDQQTAMNRSAAGYLNKSTSPETIFSCLEQVLNGKLFFQQTLNTPSEGRHSYSGEQLTTRQLEVLDLICQGKSNKLIARDLEIAENTVRAHVSAILTILGASSRTEASIIAQQQQIVRLI